MGDGGHRPRRARQGQLGPRSLPGRPPLPASSTTPGEGWLKSFAVRTLLEAVHNSPRYRLVNLTDEDRQETWRIFEGYANKAWSPFDCAYLAAARARNIGEASDEHFDQMAGEGFIRVS